MESSDLTIQVLREIRDEIRLTNGRLDQTNGQLDQTNGRLDRMNGQLDQTNGRLDRMNGKLDLTNERLEKLEKRQAQGEIRLSTEMVAVAKAVDSVRQLLAERLDLRDRVDEHDRRISALENLASE